MNRFSLFIITFSCITFAQKNTTYTMNMNNKFISQSSIEDSTGKNSPQFELGIRDELIFMITNEFNPQDKKFENTLIHFANFYA